jgi:hypothetical protein
MTFDLVYLHQNDIDMCSIQINLLFAQTFSIYPTVCVLLPPFFMEKSK